MCDPRELLISNLRLIDRLVASTCRRHGVKSTDAEEFRSIVNLRLIENDYAILRKFENRSKFSTFITVVIERLLLDYRIHLLGKWHSSASAERLGAIAVAVEKLIVRDGRSVTEAVPFLKRNWPDVTECQIELIMASLPARTPRPRHVALHEAASLQRDDADDLAMSRHRRHVSARVSRVMSGLVRGLTHDDRMILQLRFGKEMTVAQIARIFGENQRRMYSRIDRILDTLRAALERTGLTSREVLDLVGQRQTELNFVIGAASAALAAARTSNAISRRTVCRMSSRLTTRST